MSLQEKLLVWFEKHQRPLPWRKAYDPYQVWISEIMLQQTQVETALPYFDRWMKLFPNIQALAKSNEKKVLKAWEGLGYYSRARNLHHTANEIVKRYGGRFPKDYDSILSLKGIGPYSAGAISSIAFNENRPIVDGNVIRVLSRLFTISKPYDEKNKAIYWETQESLIPSGKARYFNQALMELGALICTPSNPSCALCPVQKHCKAYAKKSVDRFPIPKKRKQTVKVNAGALILKKENKFFIHKRPVGKIMGGLWEFPEWKLSQNLNLTTQQSKNRTLKHAQKEFGKSITSLKHLDAIRRSYTHHQEKLQVFESTVTNGTKPQGSKKDWPSAWILKRDLKKYPFSSAHVKITKLLRD